MLASCYRFGMLVHHLRGFGLFFSLVASKFPYYVWGADFDEKDKEDGQENAEQDLAGSINIRMVKKI